MTNAQRILDNEDQTPRTPKLLACNRIILRSFIGDDFLILEGSKMELIGRECFQDRENGKRYFGKIAMVKFERDLKNRLIEVWYVDFEDGRAVAPSYRFRLWAA